MIDKHFDFRIVSNSDFVFAVICPVIKHEFDAYYPSEVEEKVVGKELLFKVSKIVGLTLNGLPCYQVLRICSDVEIISAFHTEETIANPLEV